MLTLPARSSSATSARVIEIGRLHEGSQPVRRVVGHRHRLVFVAIGQDRQHRAEHFLPSDRHVVAHAGEHRGPHVVATIEVLGPAGTTGNQLRALGDAGLDQPLDFCELRRADHRPQVGRPVARVADAEPRGERPRARLGLVVPIAGHEHACRRVAGLAAIGEHRPHALFDGGGEIRIRQHDVGRLAAQFLRHPLDRGRRRLRHAYAGAGRSGEAHHVDIGMGRHRLAHRRAVALHHVVDAGRHAGRVQHLGPDDRAERRDLGRLQHHRAAGGQRRRHLADDLVDRPVPRRNQAAHADRLAHDHACCRAASRTRTSPECGSSVADARCRRPPARRARTHTARPSRASSCPRPPRSGARIRPGPHAADRGAPPRMVFAKSANAARAAATARSTSAALPIAMVAHASSVAGSITASVSAPIGSTHSPPM